ncbi:hypothetical protein [Croceicoccus naphthovorans]|uniref:hypothetical protein n=1 Tax=Croceicoccus naphthovorans TaxID=1348774 RepID=UPI00069F7623|nr:hypothetical protein [Croceicoccus naphthovorans]MBB3989255.1 hypothetical protein [Croceicoccus naphthovorans]
MDRTQIMDLLTAESRVRYGTVPRDVHGKPLLPGRYDLFDDQYLLHTESGLRMHYRKGAGITVEHSGDSTPEEEDLCRKGGVYAAIACIWGLFPMHASAVEWDGRIYAFTGPSGAGKSTLAAALGRHGMPMFCDDTLVLDLSDDDAIIALPGHKRLKLCDDALTMTGATAQERVAPQVDKRFAEPIAGISTNPLPIGELIYLETAQDIAIAPIRGAARALRLRDDHYTTDLLRRARGGDAAMGFAAFSRVAQAFAMHSFARPRDPAAFDRGVSMIADHIRKAAASHRGDAGHRLNTGHRLDTGANGPC